MLSIKPLINSSALFWARRISKLNAKENPSWWTAFRSQKNFCKNTLLFLAALTSEESYSIYACSFGPAAMASYLVLLTSDMITLPCILFKISWRSFKRSPGNYSSSSSGVFPVLVMMKSKTGWISVSRYFLKKLEINVVTFLNHGWH